MVFAAFTTGIFSAFASVVLTALSTVAFSTFTTMVFSSLSAMGAGRHHVVVMAAFMIIGHGAGTGQQRCHTDTSPQLQFLIVHRALLKQQKTTGWNTSMPGRLMVIPW